MKKVIAFIFTALAFVGLAQPQKINYQGVAVGANGKAIKNASVGLRLSVLDSLPNGSTLYTETQSASTDAAGQFSIYLGAGTATLGTFANIPWANGNDKFLKVEMDAQGGSNYQSIGTTQLVSVPFAFSSRVADLIKGADGKNYQLSTGANGPSFTCYPPIIQANAGADQLNICSNSLTLGGNNAVGTSSNWTILSGTGAGINGSIFTGIRGNAYTLRYTLSNACGSSSDTLQISLALPTSTSSAGPDQLSLTGTTATLAANAPAAGETGTWTIISGSGASLNNANSSTATLTKGTDSAYTLVWTITGPCGTSRDTVNLRFTAPVGTACGQAVSYSGESYSTVQIGTQCWFSKNLNVGTMITGTVDQTNNSSIEKYCYDNNAANCTTYGGYYQWGEAVQYVNGSSNTTSPFPVISGPVRGICPTGWHLPSDAEYCTLSKFLDASTTCSTFGTTSNSAGGMLKSTSGLWYSQSSGTTNSSGFSGLPGGYRLTSGAFYGIGSDANFWLTDEMSSSQGIHRHLIYYQSTFNRYNNSKIYGFSVRCVKDSGCVTTSSSAGPDQLSLTGTTATLAANTPAAGETGTWTITASSGATLNNANSPTATFTKGTDSAYTLVWTITGPCGNSRDTVNISFQNLVMNVPCPGVASVTYAGESYPTVQIGTQCWFAKNLNVGTMIQGANDQTNNSTLEKYCYNNDPANCTTYGGLYQWAEAVQYQNGASNTTSPNPAFTGNVRGICPTGWHLPSDAEYCTLTTFIDASVNCSTTRWSGTDAGGKMKSTSGLWRSPNTGATNSSGFSALPGGYRDDIHGVFYGVGNDTFFWSSSEFTTFGAVIRYLVSFESNIYQNSWARFSGFSARCIKD